jgi:putative aldouronate transport system substrate-binding protein
MKKTIALLLAVMFVLALFAGCGGNNTTPNTGDNANAGTDASTAGSNGDTPADTGDTTEDSPYNLAAGKWELNEDGLSSAKYVYELPLSTTDEVFTRWTTCYTPQYIPEGGWGEIETWKQLEEMTGVHIEYVEVSSDTRSENFATLLASDELCDIMDQAWFFYKDGTVKDAINEEEYFANLYGYREYMPNYLYEIWNRSKIGGEFDKLADAYQYAFLEDDIIAGIYGMLVDPAPGSGYWLRQDYLDALGLGAAADITTFDKLHSALSAIKAEYNISPFAIFSSIELTPGVGFSGYNTAAYATSLAYPRVIDGTVQFNGTGEDDRALMTMLNQWFTEGLIHPNFSSFTSTQEMTSELSNSEVAASIFTPSEVGAWQSMNTDPNCQYAAIPRTKLTDDQILQYGQKQGNFHYGSCAISAACENIPLVVSYWDYWFSDEGSDFTSWGPEGILWEYNENGERQLTEFCLKHEAGTAWIMCVYGNNGLVEACLQIHKRNYAYPGGELFISAFDTWTVKDYGGAYDWPSSVSFTDDQNERLSEIRNDLNTYYQENYIAFLDGSAPMSEWDNFIAGLNEFGLEEYTSIYQEGYEAYMAG